MELNPHVQNEKERKDKIKVLKVVKGYAHILILLLGDMSGGLVRLGDVCNINVVPRLDNFEVSIIP